MVMQKLINKFKEIREKQKNYNMSMEDKYNILCKLERDEISINDINYLSLSGYYSYYSRGACPYPEEEYMLIGNLLNQFKSKAYYREEKIGIWVSGVVYYRELVIENGEMIYREEIKPY